MSSFTTNPVRLDDLLKNCERGIIQLPDFQRSWVWDEERIKGLIASISQGFPVGAIMTLETGGEVEFAPRLVQGAPAANANEKPQLLLLDGQQRLTSLFQTARRQAVVETVTARGAGVKRWYYIDIRKALDQSGLREEAIIGVPEDRIVKENFGRDVRLDLSTRRAEHESLMFPVNLVFDWFDWILACRDHWAGQPAIRDQIDTFRTEVLQVFGNYQIPVISLDKQTSREAVCLVFEKVNTGGKALDAFELVTAMFAADGFRLREDWAAREARLRRSEVLANVSSIDFLQAVSLLHTLKLRRRAEAQPIAGREPPAVSATRQSLLKLPLAAYKTYADQVEEGFQLAARFLVTHRVYKARDLPYQSQLTPLAAVLVELERERDNATVRQALARWYWCGVLGELYGSATESRLARDIMEVPAWVRGHAEEPSTIQQASFDANRLTTMRTRLSAAYKGVNALLMQAGARDFLSGQPYDHTVFFGEFVDIHHIFPVAWCEKNGVAAAEYDCVINKTPLGYRTNRKIGGVAPSVYSDRIERGTDNDAPIERGQLDQLLRSHLIDPDLLRQDDFQGFIAARREALLALIAGAMGKTVYRGGETNEPETYVTEPPEAVADAA